MSLEDLLAKSRPGTGFFVIEYLPNNTYYTGRYDHFSKERLPKIYKRISDAKLGMLRQAEMLWRTIHDPFGIPYEEFYCNRVTSEEYYNSYPRWHRLEKEDTYYFAYLFYRIVELELVEGSLKEIKREG